jgi:hypothetical protein
VNRRDSGRAIYDFAGFMERIGKPESGFHPALILNQDLAPSLLELSELQRWTYRCKDGRLTLTVSLIIVSYTPDKKVRAEYVTVVEIQD